MAPLLKVYSGQRVHAQILSQSKATENLFELLTMAAPPVLAGLGLGLVGHGTGMGIYPPAATGWDGMARARARAAPSTG